MDEDIVYSMIERHSRKASEPKTTKCSSIITIILDYLKGILFLLGSLLLFGCKLLKNVSEVTEKSLYKNYIIILNIRYVYQTVIYFL
jgi:hypothetical protein